MECPECEEAMIPVDDDTDDEWQCLQCGLIIDKDGDERYEPEFFE